MMSSSRADVPKDQTTGSAHDPTTLIKPGQYKLLCSSRADVLKDQAKCFQSIVMPATFFVVSVRCKCLNLRGDSVK